MQNRKVPKKEKNPSNPRLQTTGHLMSSQGHTQSSIGVQARADQEGRVQLISPAPSPDLLWLP